MNASPPAASRRSTQRRAASSADAPTYVAPSAISHAAPIACGSTPRLLAIHNTACGAARRAPPSAVEDQ